MERSTEPNYTNAVTIEQHMDKAQQIMLLKMSSHTIKAPFSQSNDGYNFYHHESTFPQSLTYLKFVDFMFPRKSNDKQYDDCKWNHTLTFNI